MINYYEFKETDYRNPWDVFQLKVGKNANEEKADNSLPLTFHAFKDLENTGGPLEYKNLLIQLPDVIASKLVKDTIENNFDRGFNKSIDDNGSLDFSLADSLLGDRFRMRRILKEVENGEYIYPIIERYMYGNFLDGEENNIKENTFELTWIITELIISNELMNMKQESRLSFPVREQSVKIINDTGLSNNNRAQLDKNLFTMRENMGVAAELTYQYHTLEFPIYDHTEGLISDLVSPYYKLGRYEG